jgi:hypothetical protein
VSERRFCFVVDRELMSPEDFTALRRVDPRTGGSPYVLYRLLIDGKWYAVDRQFQFGLPVYFARKIVIRAQRAAA